MSTVNDDSFDPSERETKRLAPAPSARRLYGTAPVGVILAVVVGGPLAALALLVLGHALAAVVVALVACTFAFLFAAEAREALLHGTVTRAAFTAASVSRDRAAFAGSAASSWSQAAVEVGRLRARKRRLERRALDLMRELGEATFDGDHSSAQVARARASATRTLIAQTDRATRYAWDGARARVAARR